MHLTSENMLTSNIRNATILRRSFRLINSARSSHKVIIDCLLEMKALAGSIREGYNYNYLNPEADEMVRRE